MLKRKMAGVLAALLVMMTALTGCAKTEVLDGSAEALRVDGVSVPLGEVNFYLRYQQIQMHGMYAAFFGDDFLNQDLIGTGRPYGDSVRDSVIEAFNEFYIIEKHAEELGVSLTDEERKAAADAAKEFVEDNDKKTLAAMTADEKTVTHVLELQTLQHKTFETLAATIDTEVDMEEVNQKRVSFVLSSTVGSTDADGNVTELTADEMAAKKAVLEEIKAEAEESKDLSAAAEAHDLTAMVVNYGKNYSALDAEVQAVAETLKEGELSEVFETSNGYYVVMMEATTDEEATQAQIETVLSERENAAYMTWIEPLARNTETVINEENVALMNFERIFAAGVSEE